MESAASRSRARVLPSGRILELDSLRGIAAIGVALFHLGVPGTWWMWSFVDLFFVLSGFVITRLLLEPRELNGAALRSFWLRRILRIWPVYYLTLLLLLALHALRSAYGAALEAPEQVLPLFFFLQLTDLYRVPAPHPAYPEIAQDFLPYFLHSWSLAVEEQFYLVWPLLLLLLRRRPAVLLFLLASALVASSVARTQGYSVFLLVTRMDGLVLGAGLAFMEHKRLLRDAASRARCGWLCALVAAAAAATLAAGGRTNVHIEPQLVLSYSVLYAAIVGVLICFPRSRWTGALRWRWLVYLGGISYALYMFHLPVFGVGKLALAKAGIGESALTDAVLLAAVIACAAVSRVLLERPIEQLKHRLASPARGGILVGVRS